MALGYFALHERISTLYGFAALSHPHDYFEYVFYVRYPVGVRKAYLFDRVLVLRRAGPVGKDALFYLVYELAGIPVVKQDWFRQIARGYVMRFAVFIEIDKVRPVVEQGGDLDNFCIPAALFCEFDGVSDYA
jgi:hypothetical protein